MHHSTSLTGVDVSSIISHITTIHVVYCIYVTYIIFCVLRLSRHYRHRASKIMYIILSFIQTVHSYYPSFFQLSWRFFFFLLHWCSLFFLLLPPYHHLRHFYIPSPTKDCFWVNSLTTFTCFFICMINSKTRKKRKDGKKVCCPFAITLHK